MDGVVKPKRPGAGLQPINTTSPVVLKLQSNLLLSTKILTGRQDFTITFHLLKKKLCLHKAFSTPQQD
jgi:hypothetical protein